MIQKAFSQECPLALQEGEALWDTAFMLILQQPLDTPPEKAEVYTTLPTASRICCLDTPPEKAGVYTPTVGQGAVDTPKKKEGDSCFNDRCPPKRQVLHSLRKR